MAAYRADIEIGVKGVQQLQALTKQISTLSTGVDSVNKKLAGASQSLNAYEANLAKAASTLNKVNAGTIAETDAVRQYVQALGQANAARDRQNRLIQQQIALQRKAVPTANAGFGIQGPALPPQSAAKAGAGFKGRVGEALGGGIIGAGFPLLFGQTGGAAVGGAIGGVAGALAGPGGSFAGSILGTVIGEIASKGQAVKTLGEDLGFSAQQADALAAAFKTANTDVEKFTAVVQNIRGVGLDLEDQADAVQLVTALTEKYGGTWEKIGNAITSSLESGKVTQATLNQLTSQGVTIQDALAAKYNVSRDAILQMAKEGDISVQTLLDTLVELGNASTKAAQKVESPFQKAIGTTVKLFQGFWQEVQTIFAGVQGSGTQAATKLINVFNTLLQEVLLPLGRVLARIAALFVNVVSTGVSAAADLITGFRGVATAIGDAVMNIINMIPGLRTIVGLARQLLNRVAGPKSSDWNDMPWPEGVPKPGSAGMVGNITAPAQFIPTDGAGAKGPKPPKDRTAQLLEDLEAMRLISVTQDGIRDALFEGNKQLAIRLDYDQKVADINRDTAKALLGANYESEKAVIRAQQLVRLKDAQLVRDDELRDLARDVAEIIQNTLDDLRGGVNWDDTGLRNIFDMALPDAIKQTQENINSLIDPANQIVGAATAISTAFRDTFNGIVTGAVTAQEGLSNFFRSVGNYFIDMAATIAAEALKLQAISILQSLLQPLLNPFSIGTMSAPSLSGGGALSTQPLFPLGAFAEGGFVTGPTNALIGEGGEPEYVIPASKMRGAMNRYSAGARGSSVIPSDSGDGPSAGGTMTAAPIDVRYTVERINSVDYVTADQFQAGMRQAASQGAERGQQLALRRLQQSPSARRRVGMA